MRRLAFVGLLAAFVALPTLGQEKKEDTTEKKDRKEQYAELKKTFTEQQKEFMALRAKVKTQEEFNKILSKQPKATDFVPKIMALVEESPKDELSFEMLTFGVQTFGPQAKAAFKVIGDAHAANEKLKPLVTMLSQRAIPGSGPMLEKIVAANPDKSVKAFATLALANMSFGQLDDVDLKDEDRKTHTDAAKKYFLALSKEYGDLEMGGRRKQSFGDVAKKFLFDMDHLQIGMTVPDVTCETLDGKKEKISDYKGKVVVLDIWATWCGPCIAMIPHETEMVKHFEKKPFALISISADAKKETLEEFLKKKEMPWKHWWVGNEDGLTNDWNVRFFPTMYVIDAKGVIRYKNIRGEKLEEACEKLIAEAEKGSR